VTKAFEKQQKRHIIQSAKLEKEVLENQRNSIFIEGLYKISSMVYFWKTNTEDTNEAEIHHLIRELIKKDSTLLMFVFNSNYGKFATQYNIVYPLSKNIINPAGIDITNDNAEATEILPEGLDRYFPRASIDNNNNQPLLNTQDTATVTTLATTTASTQDDMDDDEDYEVVPTNHQLHDVETTRLLRILKDVFVASWSNEKRRLENQAVEIKMAKYIKMQLTLKATDDAAALVANEPAADMKQLNELIEKKVHEHTKKLQKELDSTKQQLQRIQSSSRNNPPKNSTRGETATRAGRNKSPKQNQHQRQRSNSTSKENKKQKRTQSNNRSTQNQSNNSSRNTNRKPRSRSKSNDTNNTPKRGTNNNRNQTPRRNNKRNRKPNEADDAQRDMPANNRNKRRPRNTSSSKSRNKNSSTARGRQRNQQK
jgi:hypothetical protein